jgi:hypothetical protein
MYKQFEFYQFKVEFLGYVIFGNGIRMDLHKVQTIIDWVTLAFVRNVQCFLGFVNFYRCFIAHYFSIVAPFAWLTNKDQFCSWRIEVDIFFQSLKASFTISPILIRADLSKPFIWKWTLSTLQ